MNDFYVLMLGLAFVCTTLLVSYLAVVAPAASSDPAFSYREVPLGGQEVPLDNLKLIPLDR